MKVESYFLKFALKTEILFNFKLDPKIVLANNPDLSTDAGQFTMIPEIKTTDKKIQFEFIAAVPREMVSAFELTIERLHE
jgi:hypothetical protein